MAESKTLLIVDDSRVSRMMIKGLVEERHPEWNILEAEDANQAINVCKHNRINMFSVDINMPGVDGFEFIQRIKPNHPDARVAVLTANIQKSTHQRSKELGVVCINKPVTEQSIERMLEYFS